MLKKLVPLFLLFISICSFGQTLIPDANFEQFLVDEGIDTNGITGDILNADATAVTDLNLSSVTNITNITGIAAFVNVTDLDLGNNLIVIVDLTALSSLINFRTNDNSALASVDFSQNSLLETIFMHGDFPATPPPITVVDLSQNLSLISIDGDFLDNVTDIIFPVTASLTSIELRYLSDETIDLSLLDGLESLEIGGWRSDVDITLPDETLNFKDLNISSIDIPTIDISVYSNLESLYLWGTYVENLVLPNSLVLEDIFIILHDIQHTLDLSVVPNLVDLDITSNTNTPLVVDITSNPLLEDVELSRNDMTSIDVSQNPLLEELKLNTNNLTSLDVTQNTALGRLEAYENQIPTIDLTQNVILEYLNLRSNEIAVLDVTQNVLARSINISDNEFTTTGLDLTQNIELTTLDASFNQIESLDITQNSELSSLTLNDNLFTGTDILDQFYVHYLNRDFMRMNLNVENNMLSGRIPDFFNPFPLEEQTRRNGLRFSGNAFEFGDFEDEHLDYVSLLSTLTLGSSPDFVFRDYTYAPQEKVNKIESSTRNAGEDITLTTTVRGTQNHYKWFKDGIEINGAPDAPEYTITDLNTCDAGVYHSEITSDLVPFENGNAPGTDGKNLLLVRNDITLTVNATKECVTLNMPLTDVPINSGVEWNDTPGACGYKISLGTSTGSDDLLPLTDVGEVTIYNHTTDFPANQDIFVTVIPYYDDGDFACAEQSFRTNASVVRPECTNLSAPMGNDTNVPANVPTITWNPANGADDYKLTITSTSGTNNLPETNIGNILSYPLGNDFQPGDVVNITIVPTNGIGDATGPCTTESFTIASATVTPTEPSCTNLSAPLANATDVAVDTNISWDAATNATGYRISITSTSGNNDITDFDNGNSTTYDPPMDFANDDVVTVTITPVNGSVTPTSACASESFTIVSATVTPTPPSCTNLSTPLANATDVAVDTNISWDAATDATGYRISITSTSGNNDITDFDNGNSTTYDPPMDFANDDVVTVTITPVNGTLEPTTACNSESFTIVSATVIPTPPSCTSLSTALVNATDVAVDADISWDAVDNADGYSLSVRTASNEILFPETDLAGLTTFSLPEDMPFATTIFVSVTPYNSNGNADSCSEQSFTTEEAPSEPEEPVVPETVDETKYGFSPDGDGINEYWHIDNIENYPDNTVNIYNRWGDMVFQVNGYDNIGSVFNGQANQKTKMGASELPSGTYFFNIQIDGDTILEKTQGFLVLKR